MPCVRSTNALNMGPRLLHLQECQQVLRSTQPKLKPCTPVGQKSPERHGFSCTCAVRRLNTES